MSGLFVILFFVSLLALITGLIKPSVFNRLIKKTPTRKLIGLTLGVSTVISFILIGVFAPPITKEDKQIVEPQAQNQEINGITNTQNNTLNQPIATTTQSDATEGTEINQAQQTATPTTQPQSEVEIAQSSGDLYSVTSVVDGDTIKININGTITTLRLIGMDTPETVDPRKSVQCFGKEASNKAKELLTGKKVRIEKDATQGDFDKYNRTLAYVYREDGLFYNKYMIEQGYAHEYTYNTPYKYQTEFKAAQKSAQSSQLGLWSTTACNGDTTQPAISSTPDTPDTNSSTPATNSAGRYYTSSYSTTKYYYPEACDGWKSLNSKYLKSFDTLSALLAAYPSRTLSPQCQ